MDKDSEVTSDGYFEKAEVAFKKVRATVEYVEHHEKLEKSEKSLEERKRISNNLKKNLELEYAKIDEKYQEELEEEATARKRAVLIKKKIENSTDYYEQEYYKSYYDHLIRKSNPKKAFFKSAGKGAIKGVATMVLFEMTGLIPKSEPNITIPKSSKFYKDTRYPISAEDLYVISVNDPEYYKDNSHLYKVTGELNPKAGLYNKKIEDPVILKHMTEYHNNTLTNNEKLGDGLGNLIGYIGYVGANKLLNRLDAHIYKNSNSSLVSANKITNEEQLLLENKVNSVQRNVLINNVKTGETTKAYQNITTYPDGSMSISQKNLTTGEISFQGINSSGQRVFETSLTPHEANTLIGANSSSKMLVGNGAVSQSVISKVSYQTGNNSLVLYDKTPVPVATNGALVPPLTTNRALATVPLLTDGANKVVSKLPYNPVLKSPVKYPNYTSVQNEVVKEFNNSKLYDVVPEMSEIDMQRGTLVNNSYIKNPSAKDITKYVNNTNYLGTGGKKGALNGEYMYAIDANNNIIIGNRVTNQVVKKHGLPHPTLLGGKNPQVQGAGIIEIRGGKIYKIDNASGHFQPGTESLKRTEEVFHEKIPSKYFSNGFEGFKTYDNK